MNVFTCTGRLGKDPEIVHFSDSGSAEAKLNVSTRRYERGKEITDWHTVIVRSTDVVKKVIEPYAKSGMTVSISGELGYETFVGREGTNIKMAKIFVNSSKGFELHRPSSAANNSETELHSAEAETFAL